MTIKTEEKIDQIHLFIQRFKKKNEEICAELKIED